MVIDIVILQQVKKDKEPIVYHIYRFLDSFFFSIESDTIYNIYIYIERERDVVSCVITKYQI